eukprot:scaffold3167_cov132-Skeletonema_dohrnii-CCMP3373.AAC.10
MDFFASNKVEAGRKTAALRVRQRQKRESLRWSPSGKLRLKTPHSRRSPTTQIDIPWNDRFIFDDESQHKGATNSKDRRIVSRRGCNDKENVANSSSSGKRIRHYTERSDGVAVAYFQHIEVSAAADGVGKRPPIVETCSIAISPFNMAKVMAALRADSLSEPKTPHEMENIIDQFEDLILTMEIEEELVRRDLELDKMKVKSKEPKETMNDEDKALQRGKVEGKSINMV